MEAWDKVVAATEHHNIDRITTTLDDSGRSWTYIECACYPSEDHQEAFRESWEFTDHIRRITYRAVTDGSQDG
jgi:hypothetical protein